MSWRPLLDGAERERALAAIRDIAADLDGCALDDGNAASLASGRAGLALCHAYLARAGLASEHTAAVCLEKAVEDVAEQPMGPDLYAGFTGVAWAAEHLAPDDDANSEVDAALFDLLAESPWTGDYDLIVGLVGFGVYALERRERGRPLLERVVDRLGELAQTLPGAPGHTWRTPPELMLPETAALFPDGNYNCGLAHGVPGVIALLGMAGARPLLDGAVAWLLAQRAPAPDGSLFPASVSGASKFHGCRAAWCYGDPGIGVALLAAARAAGEPGWEREALAILSAVARRDPAHTGVVDAGLCHGAAGLAHIFNRVWQAGGDPEFAAAARSWYGRALDLRQPGRGVGGYLAWGPGPGAQAELDWFAVPGILTGSAGIALALLSAVEPIEPAWDACLLTNVKPL